MSDLDLTDFQGFLDFEGLEYLQEKNNALTDEKLKTKQDKITGGASTITSSNLTTNRALISNSSGKVAVSDVTSTELGYLDGVTSAIQTQLNNITSNYETKTSASSKLTEAKTYADTVSAKVKSDLLNGASGAYDTLKELGDLIDDNHDAIEALETVAAGKANKTHSHAISDVTNLQSTLDGKAATNHGTHVTYGTDIPKVAGTGAVGTATGLARIDHVHPAQTSVSGNSGTTTKFATSRRIDGVLFNGSADITRYAECTTDIGISAKSVTLNGFNALVTGARVTIKFTKPNSATSPTLDVNGTGAKPIYHKGTVIKSEQYWKNNDIIDFIYDGTNWNIIGIVNDNGTGSSTGGETYTAGTGLSLNNNEFSLSDSGVTAGSYGQSSNANPAHNGTFSVPYITVDSKGRVTSASTKTVTLPSGGSATDTDTKNTAGATDSSSKLYLIGATEQGANPQTYSHDTAYIGADGCLYSNGTKVSVSGHGHSTVSDSTNGFMTSSDKVKLDKTNVAYGTCTTSPNTASKAVTLSGNTNWKLEVGAMIIVKFNGDNMAQNPTLNVNNTGAYPIEYEGVTITTANLTYAGKNRRHITYMFNGTNYVFISWSYDSNTTYTNASLGIGYTTCDTDSETAAKTASLTGYSLVNGSIVAVRFTNDVLAGATLSINSKTARPLYYRNSVITDGVINAGDVATFVNDGSAYHLLAIDRPTPKFSLNGTTLTITTT